MKNIDDEEVSIDVLAVSIGFTMTLLIIVILFLITFLLKI